MSEPHDVIDIERIYPSPPVTSSSTAFSHSGQLSELAQALSKAQGEIQHASKNAANPYFKSKYADLASVMDVIREPFAKHGLAVVQGPFTSESGFVILRTRLLHSSGEWIESCVQASAKDTGPQAIGSVITYLRRYALSAMAGVATEDDDGEAGEARSSAPAQKQTKGAKKKDAAETISKAQAAELWSMARAQAENTGTSREQIMRDILKALDLKGTEAIPVTDYEKVKSLIAEWEPEVLMGERRHGIDEVDSTASAEREPGADG